MAGGAYVSTRGAPCGDFEDALLAGLAPDGGLAVPAAWPSLPAGALAGLSYADLVARVLGAFGAAEAGALAAAAYAGWVPAGGPPLRELAPGLFLLELFHGPTLAFKDFALQLLARLLERALAARGATCTLLAATSGDTGSAAIAAFAGRTRTRLVVLHPAGRISDVQRRQMTTVRAGNICNLAVEGDFDDCQALVKAAFADAPLRERHRLGAVNSINWARIAAQVGYFAAAARHFDGGPVSFAVPTGNFGNVFAAYAAGRLGTAPVARLIVGSNRNDILTRFFEDGAMVRRLVEPSLSPSMDIAVSSNFERLAFELLDRDPAATRAVMRGFAATGRLDLPKAAWQQARGLFRGHRLSDPETLAVMRETWRDHGMLIDPHTAVALAAARAHAIPGVPTVVVATAHPAKFPDAVAAATGERPALPEALADLYDRPEFYRVVPPRLDAVAAAIDEAALETA